MTQSELNRQIAKQTGESVADIARLGFTILTELPQDEDNEFRQPQTKAAWCKSAAFRCQFSVHHRIAVRSVFTP